MRAALVAVAVTGCIRGPAYECTTDVDCLRAGTQGTCQPVGFCSFPDASCATGQRFGDLSGSVANQCVGDGSGEAGVDVAVDTSSGACPAGYAGLPGVAHLYRKLSAAQIWTSQRDACAADGANAYIAVPDDATELGAILALAGADIWVGVDDLGAEGTYKTVRGDPATFLPWATGQPNNVGNEDCELALAATQQYDDRRCSDTAIAVCECEP